MPPISFPPALPCTGVRSAAPRAPRPQRHCSRVGLPLAAAVGLGLIAAAWPATTAQTAPASKALTASTSAVLVTCRTGMYPQATAPETLAAAGTVRSARSASSSVEVAVVAPALTTMAGGTR